MKRDRKIRRELLDELLAGYSKPEDLTGPEGLLKQLTGALVERALQAELTDHLGYDEHAVEGRGSGNSRNGSGTKTLQTEQGPVPRSAHNSLRLVHMTKRAELRIMCTTHVCTTVLGKTASMASGKPLRPSQQAMKMSSTPRFFSSVMHRQRRRINGVPHGGPSTHPRCKVRCGHMG